MVPGAALVWKMAVSRRPRDFEMARERPAGLALIAILPPASSVHQGDVLSLVDRCRPHSVLPFHPEPQPDDLAVVLRRPPEALSVEVVDYLTWRGIRVDGDTRQLIRRTLDLSESVHTVSGLARALYLSRRALGRRFLSRGLPAPSHWLQFGRTLRAALTLQSTDDSLFSIATELGYPDGFALSNQMKRLTGIRPSTVRTCFGWEWIVEAWLRTERRAGALRFDLGPPSPPSARRVAEPMSLETAVSPEAGTPVRTGQ
jgi:AraC-like DNA-binding protein